MKIELSERDVHIVIAAMMNSENVEAERIELSLKRQRLKFLFEAAPVVADAADDGPEVYLIRSFFIFPGGAFGGFEYMKQALLDLWENWS